MKKYCYNCMEELDTCDICLKCGYKNETNSVLHHLTSSTLLNNRYIVGNPLGEGGFGITYIGLDTMLDMKVAIKEFFPNGYANRNNSVSLDVITSTKKQKEVFEKGKIRFLQEARNIAKFNREKGIVDVRDYFEENGTAYIIMEYLEGMTLSQCIKRHGRLNAERLFELFIPIMESLKNIHDAGIIHRDISPDNVMYLTDGTLKLMDFGSARYFSNDEKTISVMLKQGYAPEEQYRKNGKQGPFTDVYGLCATLYRCISGKIPDDALDRLHEDTLKAPSQLGAYIDPELEKILMYGLMVNSEDRCKDMATLIALTKKALKKIQDNRERPESEEKDEEKTIPQESFTNGKYKTERVDFTSPEPKKPDEYRVHKEYKAQINYCEYIQPEEDDPYYENSPSVLSQLRYAFEDLIEKIRFKIDEIRFKNKYEYNPYDDSDYDSDYEEFEDLDDNFDDDEYQKGMEEVETSNTILVSSIIAVGVVAIILLIIGMVTTNADKNSQQRCKVATCRNYEVLSEDSDYCEMHSEFCLSCDEYINPGKTFCSDCGQFKDKCLKAGCDRYALDEGYTYYCVKHSEICAGCYQWINPGDKYCPECE